MSMQHCDVLILGGGLAGLSTALHLAERFQVTILAKRELEVSSSQWAQGGIAAVLADGDSFDAHVHDTLVAGALLNDLPATRFVVEHGPAAIAWLRGQGVPFDTEHGDLHLTREGGHSQRRIAHVADATGAAIQRTLLARARAHPRITLLEHHVDVDLITNRHMDMVGPRRCWGAYALNTTSNRVETYPAAHTVLATGGAGKVYRYTTNPDTASGDGLAMAWRAGCRVANMEFIQFHPTCLYHPKAKSFLISEALRGEGGILRNKAGEAFMVRYDPRKELAPRDVVARSIDAEVKRRGDDCAFLDMTHLPKAFLLDHFPHIYATCREFGIDMAAQPIPVVPAAHYQCGGVVTDLHGATSLPRLFAVGEVSCTGLHGANRLASNSLLEGLVFGRRAALVARELLDGGRLVAPDVPPWNPGNALAPDEGVVVTHNWEEVRRTMWNYVGIVRTTKRLERARSRLRTLRSEIREYYWQYKVTPDLVELRNLADMAMLVIESALRRKESRGLHYTLDYPDADDAQLRDTVLTRSDAE